MYSPSSYCGVCLDLTDNNNSRDQLREQHQLGEEIANAITSQPVGEQPDEDELDAELEGLEQEAMDERMLKTGTVPVNDQVNRLPAAANGESKSTPTITPAVLSCPLSNNPCFLPVKETPKQAEEEDEEAELEKLRAEMAM